MSDNELFATNSIVLSLMVTIVLPRLFIFARYNLLALVAIAILSFESLALHHVLGFDPIGAFARSIAITATVLAGGYGMAWFMRRKGYPEKIE